MDALSPVITMTSVAAPSCILTHVALALSLSVD